MNKHSTNPAMKTLNLSIPGLTIACKLWGNPKNPPIVAVHGWLDNANSFDYLAEFLLHDFYFIAIDLPGHVSSDKSPLLRVSHVQKVFLLYLKRHSPSWIVQVLRYPIFYCH